MKTIERLDELKEPILDVIGNSESKKLGYVPVTVNFSIIGGRAQDYGVEWTYASPCFNDRFNLKTGNAYESKTEAEEEGSSRSTSDLVNLFDSNVMKTEVVGNTVYFKRTSFQEQADSFDESALFGSRVPGLSYDDGFDVN